MFDLWATNDHNCWLSAENKYYELVLPDNYELEKELETIELQQILEMNSGEFYNFLYHKYFVWKYTAQNRLTTTRRNLTYYENNLEELSLIKNALFSFNTADIQLGLKIAMLIKGLGCAGASGLLSILFPMNYATVDQFVVQRLCEFSAFEIDTVIHSIKPESIKLKEAVYLEQILIDKAHILNRCNNTDYWTPRKIDKVLWALNR